MRPRMKYVVKYYQDSKHVIAKNHVYIIINSRFVIIYNCYGKMISKFAISPIEGLFYTYGNLFAYESGQKIHLVNIKTLKENEYPSDQRIVNVDNKWIWTWPFNHREIYRINIDTGVTELFQTLNDTYYAVYRVYDYDRVIYCIVNSRTHDNEIVIINKGNNEQKSIKIDMYRSNSKYLITITRKRILVFDRLGNCKTYKYPRCEHGYSKCPECLSSYRLDINEKYIILRCSNDYYYIYNMRMQLKYMRKLNYTFTCVGPLFATIGHEIKWVKGRYEYDKKLETTSITLQHFKDKNYVLNQCTNTDYKHILRLII